MPVDLFGVSLVGRQRIEEIQDQRKFVNADEGISRNKSGCRCDMLRLEFSEEYFVECDDDFCKLIPLFQNVLLGTVIAEGVSPGNT